MFDCNFDITIWNKWRNAEAKADEFIRHIIPVSSKWKGDARRSISGNTANNDSSFVVIMPYSDMYTSPDEWRNLDTDGRARHFTIQSGDIVALGVHLIEITGVSPFTKNEVKLSLAPNCFEVKLFRDNTRSQYGRHYRIEGY